MTMKEAKELVDTNLKNNLEAARDLLLSIPEASEFPIYHYLLAKISKDLGHRDAAILHLEKSIEINPNNLTALLNVSESKIRSGDSVDGKSLLFKAIELGLENSSHTVKAATLLAKVDETESAKLLLEKASILYPNDKLVKFALARILYSRAEYDSFVNVMHSAISQSSLSDSIKARISLSKYYFTIGDFNSVLEILNPIADIIRDDKAGDLVKSMLILVWIEKNNEIMAKNTLHLLTQPSSIPSNYAWARFQLYQNNVSNAYDSSLAIRASCSSLVEKFENRKSILENSSSDSTSDYKRELLVESSLTHVSQLAICEILPEITSVRTFLDQVHNVYLSMIQY